MYRMFAALLFTLGLAVTAGTARAQQPPDAPPASDLKEWFYADGANVAGPVALAEIRGLAGTMVKDETQVFVERNGWRFAKDHPELADLFQAAPPAAVRPPPPPPVASKAELDQRARAYILGTWQTKTMTSGNGFVFDHILDTTYLADGTLTGVIFTTSRSGGPAVSAAYQGSWTLQATDADHFILSTTAIATTGVPTTSQSTITLRIVDRNTVEDTTTGDRAVRTR